MNKSILQEKKECVLCGQRSALHRHHVMFGTANRAKAEKYGLTVYLCQYHHTGTPNGVHFNKKIDLELKKMAQKKFEEIYGHDLWMAEIGKNYL